MRIVLDTNVLLTSISSKSSIHDVFLNFIEEKYELCVTTEILIEYEEVITRHMGKAAAANILAVIDNAPNVCFITRYFAWNLIAIDPDDNKFVDCAIAADARFIVSEDKHFNVLKEISFPTVQVLKVDAFREILITN
jgi:uncharacterized protein